MTSKNVIVDNVEINESIDDLKRLVGYVCTQYDERIKELTAKLEAVAEYASRVDEMEAEHAKCIAELEMEKDNFYRDQIDNITRKLRVEYYKPRRRSVKLPKCDKCDKDRRISFISPISGKLYLESCPFCGEDVDVYSTDKTYLCEFEFRRDDKKEIVIIPDYCMRVDGYQVRGKPGKIISETGNIPDIDEAFKHCNGEYMFESKEMCDEFCRRLTEHYNKTEVAEA